MARGYCTDLVARYNGRRVFTHRSDIVRPMRDAIIVKAVRTPFGQRHGVQKDIP
jgi:hypothetical protein